MSFKSSILLLLTLILLSQHAFPEPTKVALVVGFSADNSNTAIKMCRGVDTFFYLHKEAKKDLSIQYFDNLKGQKKLKDIIEDISHKGIQYIVGLPQSNDAIPVSQFVNKKNILFIAPLATNKTITTNKKNVFRIRYSDDYQSKIIAEYIHDELKMKKILMLINLDSLYSIGLSDYLSKDLSKNKNQKVKAEKYYYDKFNINYPEITKTINKHQPDIIFIPDYSSTASLLIRHIYSINKSLVFMGADAWNRKEIADGLKNIKDNINLIHTTDWFYNLNTSINKKFTNEFKRLFPEIEPDAESALTYDSLYVLWYAIKTAKNKKNINEIIEIIEHKKFNTTAGSLNYRPNTDHDPIKTTYIIRFDIIKNKESLIKKYEAF